MSVIMDTSTIVNAANVAILTGLLEERILPREHNLP